MRLKIPITMPQQPVLASSIVANRNLSIPIGFQSVKNMSHSRDEKHTLRVFAAAGALCDPVLAMQLASIAEDSPEKVIDPGLKSAELKELQELLGTIAVYSASSNDDVEVNDSHKAVANAVSADVNSVALAYSKLKDKKANCTSALKWVASIDATLLAKAAKVGTIEVQLNLVPTDKSVQLELSQRVDSLEEEIVKLKAAVVALKKAK